MAAVIFGALGATSGKLAHLVYFKKGEKAFVRLAPQSKTSNPSETQLATQTKFALMQSFLSKANGMVQKGFETVGSNSSANSSAMNEAFRVNVKNALIGSGSNIEIDYEKVLLTSGKLPAPSNLAASSINAEMTLSWYYIAAQVGISHDDMLSVLIYNVDKDIVLQFDRVANRVDGTAVITLPPDFVGNEVLTWAMFESQAKAGQVSTTTVVRTVIS